jgi:hypothetical protein
VPIDPVNEQLEAYNTRNLERFLACYAQDVVVEDGSGTRLMQRREAMRATYAKLFAKNSDLHAEVVNRIRVGDFVIDEERVTGMQGMSEPVHAAVIYPLRDDATTQVRMLD